MIFWINSPFDPLPLEGGRPMRYELLAKALVRAGHEVVWWSSDFHHLRKEKRSLEPVYKHEGVEVRLILTMPYRSNVGLRRIASHCRYAASWRKMAVEVLNKGDVKPPDVIIISMPPLGLFNVATQFRGAFGCSVILDVQDAWPENFYSIMTFLPRSLLKFVFLPLKQAAKRAYTGADYICAVAERYIKLAASYGSLSPARVFPLGGLLPNLPKCVEQPTGSLKMIYVGNFGSSYDLETVFCVIKTLVDEGIDISLDIAGDGPRREEVEYQAKNSGGCIRFHGYLCGTDLTSVMLSCDLGIIPMKDEMLVAVPNKLVDYSSHGLAVINGLSTETKQLLDENNCGLSYTPGDVGSFKDAVMRYHNDRELLRIHKNNARDMAINLFDASVISNEMAKWIVSQVARTV